MNPKKPKKAESPYLDYIKEYKAKIQKRNRRTKSTEPLMTISFQKPTLTKSKSSITK